MILDIGMVYMYATTTTVDIQVHLNTLNCVYGNLWFGKRGVLHCSLWAVLTINFPHTQHRMFKCT